MKVAAAAVRHLTWILALSSPLTAFAHHGGGGVGVGTGSPDNRTDTEGDLITIPIEIPLNPEPEGSDSTGPEWHLSPMVYLGVNYQDRLVSLARPDAGPIRLDSSAAGYRLMQYRRLDAGIGAEVEVHPIGGVETAAETILGGFGIYMGLQPVYGRAVFADRFVPNKAAIASLPPLRLPYATADFARWNVADKMTFSQKGGIFFMGGVAYYGLSAGVTYLAQGQWSTLIEKVSPNSVRVHIAKGHLNSLSASANFGLAISGLNFVSIGVNRFGVVDRNFSYEFDLRDVQAARAYVAMLHGDLRIAQGLAESQTSVRKIDAGQSRGVGSTAYWKYGIPLLATASGSRGHIYSVADQQNFQDGSRSTTHMAVYVNERRTRGALSHHVFKASDFWGSFFTRYLANGKKQEGHEATFRWSYERDGMSDERLELAVADLERVTGLHGKLLIDFPSANLGYAHVQFEAHIDGKATDELMEAAQGAAENDLSGGRFGQVAREWVDRYFSEGDVQGLCRGHLWYRHGDMNNLLQLCRGDWISKATKASAAMLEAMREMNKTEDHDHAAFAAAYARFGKAMLATPFNFKAALVIASIDMKYLVEGERIPHIERKLAWQPSVR